MKRSLTVFCQLLSLPVGLLAVVMGPIAFMEMGKHMKQVINTSILILSLASYSQAQTSSTTVSTPSAAPASTVSMPVASAANTSKFGFTFISQSLATKSSTVETPGRPNIESYNSLGLKYKVDSKISTELRANFKSVFNNKLPDETYKNENSVIDPTLHFNYASDLKLLNSAPIKIGTRYYVPVSEASQNAKSLGALRAVASIDWELNTKVGLSYLVDSRIYLYDSSAKDNDAAYRITTGPQLAYNFTDKVNVYYGPSLDLKSTKLNRGELVADKANTLVQEVGLNITVGKVTINPAFATSANSLGTAGYEGMYADSNSEYDLTILASF